MEEKVDGLTQSECMRDMIPVRDAMDVLSGKWKLPIIVALRFGTKRFREISREIPKISDRMLSKELKDLEINELIHRKVYDSFPVVVEYSLTDYGRTLNEVIEKLRDWGQAHRKRMLER